MTSEPSFDDPTISVVIPAFNAEQHLASAIDSVVRQTYPVLEVIVVDDTSTDQTQAIARGHQAVTTVLRRGIRGGPGAARNDGVASARGTQIAFLDADDLWAEDKLERQVAALRSQPEFSMATCLVSEFYDAELTDGERAAMPLRRAAASIPSTILIERAAFDSTGGFVEDSGSGIEALEWGLAVQEAGIKVLSVSDAIVYRRLHARNTSRLSRTTQHHGYLSALKASLDRRRAKKRDQQ